MGKRKVFLYHFKKTTQNFGHSHFLMVFVEAPNLLAPFEWFCPMFSATILFRTQLWQSHTAAPPLGPEWDMFWDKSKVSEVAAAAKLQLLRNKIWWIINNQSEEYCVIFGYQLKAWNSPLSTAYWREEVEITIVVFRVQYEAPIQYKAGGVQNSAHVYKKAFMLEVVL